MTRKEPKFLIIVALLLFNSKEWGRTNDDNTEIIEKFGSSSHSCICKSLMMFFINLVLVHHHTAYDVSQRKYWFPSLTYSSAGFLGANFHCRLFSHHSHICPSCLFVHVSVLQPSIGRLLAHRSITAFFNHYGRQSWVIRPSISLPVHHLLVACLSTINSSVQPFQPFVHPPNLLIILSW